MHQLRPIGPPLKPLAWATIGPRIGAARPHKSGQGSRWRVGKKAFTIPIHTEKDVIAETG